MLNEFILQAIFFLFLPLIYIGVLQFVRLIKGQHPVAGGRFPMEVWLAVGAFGITVIVLFVASPNPDLNSPMFLPQSTTNSMTISDIAYRTALPFASDTPSPSPTFTPTNTFTPTPTPTFTNTPTLTPTLIPTQTFTPSPTPTNTHTPTYTPVPDLCTLENVRIVEPAKGKSFLPGQQVKIRGAAYEVLGQVFKPDKSGQKNVELEYLLLDKENLDKDDYGVERDPWKPIATFKPGTDLILSPDWDWASFIPNLGQHRVWLRLRAPLDRTNASAAMPSLECVPYIFVVR